MSFVQKLMEAPNLMNIEQIAGMDEDGNIIVVGEGWAYISETGMMMSEYLADGGLREETCGEKQKIEMLYLIPYDLKPEEYDRIFAIEHRAFPLPPNYHVEKIVGADNVFFILPNNVKFMIAGSYATIEQQLASAAHSYYTRGLAVNVLERYYFEFLVESHQLYLKEQKFKQERKERKKNKSDLKNNKITIKHFYQDKNGQSSCKQEIKLWGVTTTLYANFKECSENKEWTLEAFITQLNTHILWVENHEKEIQKALLDADMVNLANYWMEGWEVVDEDDNKTYYELDNKELFPCPITEDVFLNCLYIQSITIDSDTPKETRIHFFLGTEPDFFAYHSIELFIDAETMLQESNQMDIKYSIHVGGLAG
ncbi:hypothetical protein IMSAGC011_01952 [Lachnospiraceae bacterium]|nr:hypothetical protein IMSAGC011_01952 [Lachnospiraceae bacterium]